MKTLKTIALLSLVLLSESQFGIASDLEFLNQETDFHKIEKTLIPEMGKAFDPRLSQEPSTYNIGKRSQWTCEERSLTSNREVDTFNLEIEYQTQNDSYRSLSHTSSQSSSVSRFENFTLTIPSPPIYSNVGRPEFSKNGNHLKKFLHSTDAYGEVNLRFHLGTGNLVGLYSSFLEGQISRRDSLKIFGLWAKKFLFLVKEEANKHQKSFFF